MRKRNCQHPIDFDGIHWSGRNEQRRRRILRSRSLFSGCPSSVSGKNFSQFASPNYPYDYPNGQNCSWGITVPDGFIVKVEFSHFSTEWDYDQLLIYDGPSASSSLLMNLTGRLWTPRRVLSTGSSLWFNFRSDHRDSRSGFEAKFTAVDPGTVSGEFSNMDSITINIELCQLNHGKYHFISSVDCRSGIDSGYVSWAALSFTSVRGQIVRDTEIIVPGPVHNCKSTGDSRKGNGLIPELEISKSPLSPLANIFPPYPATTKLISCCRRLPWP